MRNKIILILILLFAFFSRVWRLDTPPTFYFDEVYHAFTAKEMLLGNKMAWEWWNTPPAGFAYEWTHPPLAKEAMEIGIGVVRAVGGVGSDAFGWRFPGVLAGVGVILLIYLLGKQLFNVRAGLIAAFLGSCDGLLFTQSRIGMNDIYFLFFMLLAFYLFIKSGLLRSPDGNFFRYKTRGGPPVAAFVPQKFVGLPAALKNSIFSKIVGFRLLLLMGISLGLALASKWTAIYGIGILGGLYIISGLIKLIKAWPCKAARPGLVKLVAIFFFTFLIIPVAVYLLTYLPFFTSGHSWAQFSELQHQMWWYHTGLKATHPYTSSWYSWPLMQRPVWYYVNYGNQGMIANIYAMGNPVIWWAGVAAIAATIFNFQFSIFKMIKSVILRHQPKNLMRSFASLRMTSLFIVLLGYFGFFLPWALSPRIMFLYHYLPSLPFLFLGLGWALGKIWERGVISKAFLRIGEIWGIRITGKMLTTFYLLLAALAFVYFYPQLSALPVTKAWSDQYFWFTSWR